MLNQSGLKIRKDTEANHRISYSFKVRFEPTGAFNSERGLLKNFVSCQVGAQKLYLFDG